MNGGILERYGLWWIAAALFFGFFFQLGSVPLFDLDEGAFTEATREMLASGNYLTTYLNGELRFDKPILIYWLQAFSVTLFGLNEFALRLPSALAATAWVALLYLFVRRYYDRSVAVTAAFFMATALQVTIIAKAAIADALLNLFIAATMFLIYRYHVERRKLLLYAVFALIGLGALTKGPIAVLIPGAVTLIFFAIKKELGFWAKTVFNPVGLLIFAAVAGPWYVLEYLDQGQAFIDGFFLKHNVNRFSGSMEGHAGSLFYYIPVLLVGTLPYTSLLFRAVGNIRHWIKDDLLLFLTVWFLFVFLFFSLSGTKLPHYVIYGYTPLFVIMALHVDRLRSDVLMVLPLLLLMGFFLFLPEIAGVVRPYVKDDFARLVMQSAPAEFGTSYRLCIGAALVLLVGLLFMKRPERRIKLLALGLISVITLNGAVIPAYAKIAQAPVRDAALMAKAAGYDVHLWKLNMPSFLVYSEKTAKRTPPEAGEYVLTKRPNLEAFDAYELLYEKHGIALAKILPTPKETE